MFRGFWTTMVALLAMTASGFAQPAPVFPPPASSSSSKMLLIPIDDRPATGQFAEMIAAMAAVQVEMPPTDMLGQFLSPGSADRILDWLASKDLGQYRAVIVSTDMIAYGGLIASRVPQVSADQAIARLQRLEVLRRRTPGVPFFAFSSLQRLMPTSVLENRRWREILQRTVIRRERFLNQPTLPALFEFVRLASLLPPGELENYDLARQRNLAVHAENLRMTQRGTWEYLILGQDDAQAEGPQIFESRVLRQWTRDNEIENRVYFCEGIDQHANVLVSRALLAQTGYTPKVRVVYADPLGTTVTPPYETQPLNRSIVDQIVASGARVASEAEDADYSIYINTPDPRSEAFAEFAESLKNEVDMGFPVAVADINLGKSGTGDPRLFQVLMEGDRAMKLLSYAGWNTAGNTLGTAIPAANVTLASRRMNVDPVVRELGQRTFLLHRLVNDFEYHRFTRPMAYAFIDQNPPAAREETYGAGFQEVNRIVREDLGRRLNDIFRMHFEGRRFFAGTRQYEVRALKDVDIELPWPRAYEVRLGFQVVAREVRY